ncbi:hypothetical protein ScPMuIL_009007 [Solemya velum]
MQPLTPSTTWIQCRVVAATAVCVMSIISTDPRPLYVVHPPQTVPTISALNTFVYSGINVFLNNEITFEVTSSPEVTIHCMIPNSATCTSVDPQTTRVRWLPTSLDEVQFSFVGQHANGGVTEVLVVPVTICACVNGDQGTCNFVDLQNDDQCLGHFKIATCECAVGWTGTKCDEDFRGCEGHNSCSANEQCVDLIPADHSQQENSFTCEECEGGQCLTTTTITAPTTTPFVPTTTTASPVFSECVTSGSSLYAKGLPCNIPIFGQFFQSMTISTQGIVALDNYTTGLNPQPLLSHMGHQHTMGRHDACGVTTGAVKKETTFELLLATDGCSTYLLYIYFPKEHSWTSEKNVFAGWDAGDNINSYNFIQTQATRNTGNTNSGTRGIHIFKMFKETGDFCACVDWGKTEPNTDLPLPLPDCPCTMGEAEVDPAFQIDSTDYCAQLVDATADGYGLLCCYEEDSASPAFNSLITTPRGPSKFYHYHPDNTAQHQASDVLGEQVCTGHHECFCDMYYRYRPTPTCTGYVINNIAGTLDSDTSVIHAYIGQQVKFYVNNPSGTNVTSIIPSGASSLQLTDTKTYVTWTPATLDPVEFKFIGTIDGVATTSLLHIPVTLCPCSSSENGDCDFDFYQHDQSCDSSFRLATCKCKVGWTGSACDTDFNGCDDGSDCGNKVNCVDFNPADHQANERSHVCGQCPDGFEDILGQCEDIDECSDPTVCNTATSSCINTEGSYYCACLDGFTSQDGCLEVVATTQLVTTTAAPVIKHVDMEFSVDGQVDLSDIGALEEQLRKLISATVGDVEVIINPWDITYDPVTGETKIPYTVKFSKPVDPKDLALLGQAMHNAILTGSKLNIGDEEFPILATSPFIFTPLANGTILKVPLGIYSDYSACTIFISKSSCRHNGICVEYDGRPSCNCTADYVGQYCEFIREVAGAKPTYWELPIAIGAACAASGLAACIMLVCLRKSTKGGVEKAPSEPDDEPRMIMPPVGITSGIFLPRFKPNWKQMWAGDGSSFRGSTRSSPFTTDTPDDPPPAIFLPRVPLNFDQFSPDGQPSFLAESDSQSESESSTASTRGTSHSYLPRINYRPFSPPTTSDSGSSRLSSEFAASGLPTWYAEENEDFET